MDNKQDKISKRKEKFLEMEKLNWAGRDTPVLFEAIVVQILLYS